MRSRSLVCGTCVGIGLQHLNLAATHFDWVIIDEGARSSPSELQSPCKSGPESSWSVTIHSCGRRMRMSTRKLLLNLLAFLRTQLNSSESCEAILRECSNPLRSCSTSNPQNAIPHASADR